MSAEAEFEAALAADPPATAREAAYAAVRASGLLTGDAYVNARTWRSVEAALDAYEATMPPTFGVHWTCVAHGDACEKLGLDWDCTDAPWAVALREKPDEDDR